MIDIKINELFSNSQVSIFSYAKVVMPVFTAQKRQNNGFVENYKEREIAT